MNAEQLLLSVIVPAHRPSAEFEHCLTALRASNLPRESWELIVVIDGGSNGAAEIAARQADEVVSLPGKPRGPSYARNRGAEVARGEWLVFIDSDVRVHADTLGRFAEVIEQNSKVAAVFGSYDDNPPAQGVTSKYRNLLHHYVHQQSAGEAETFWAGCGAVHRAAFWEVGMFDEWHFSRPQIEDIELGRRIRRHGRRILLRPEIQATHLKRWTLWEILATDFKNRGVPWMRLIISEGGAAGSSALNLRPLEKWSTASAALAVLAVLVAIMTRSPWPLLVPAAVAAFIIGTHVRFYRLIRRQCGWWVAAGSIPLHLVHYIGNAACTFWGWLAHTVVGPPAPPPDVAALDELGVEGWPPVPSRPKESLWRIEETLDES